MASTDIKAVQRILGHPDPTIERAHIGIYDALDALRKQVNSQASSSTTTAAAGSSTKQAQDDILKANALTLLATPQINYFSDPFYYSPASILTWTGSGTGFAVSSNGNDSGGGIYFILTGAGHTGIAQMATPGVAITGVPSEDAIFQFIFKASTSSVANTQLCLGLTDNLLSGTVYGIGVNITNRLQFMVLTSGGGVSGAIDAGPLDGNYHLFTLLSSKKRLYGQLDALGWVDLTGTSGWTGIAAVDVIPAYRAITSASASINCFLDHISIAVPSLLTVPTLSRPVL